MPEIQNRQAEINAIHAEIFGQKADPIPPTIPHPVGITLDDVDLLAKTRGAANGDKFTRLWDGDITSYSSHSEADLALCSLLASHCGGDQSRIDRFFRQSGLMRSKWDENHGACTYGQITIARALQGKAEFYSPNGHRKWDKRYQDPPIGEVLRNLTESAVRKQSPTFPDLAWHPLLARMRDWIIPCTESPLEWVFSAAKTAVELVIGRQVYVQMGRRLYANSAQVNIGPAAEKKGTPWALLVEEVLLPYRDLVGLSENTFQIAGGTGSAEGLLQMFMSEHEEERAKGAKMAVLEPVPGKRVLTIEEELGYLLVKAHSKATANLRETICQLWDGVNVSPPTRQRSLRVVEPFYSILTMTTPETLSSRLEEDDILSGMLTRFVFYQGTPRAPIAWPDAPDPQAARLLAEELSKLNAHVHSVSRHGASIEPSPAARSAWEEAYLLTLEQRVKPDQPERCRPG